MEGMETEIGYLANEFANCRKVLIALGDENRQHLMLEMMQMGNCRGVRVGEDVKFTMYVSVLSTIVVRLLLSGFLGIVLNMGVIGIAIAMVSDWVIRAIIFFRRQRSGRWKTFQVI